MLLGMTVTQSRGIRGAVRASQRQSMLEKLHRKLGHSDAGCELTVGDSAVYVNSNTGQKVGPLKKVWTAAALQGTKLHFPHAQPVSISCFNVHGGFYRT